MGDLPQTLADLRREVFGESAATRATRAPLRPLPMPNNPAAQRYNANRARARAGGPAREDFARFGAHRQAFAPPRNQFAELPQIALEATGLPSVRRSARAFASGDPQGGAMEGFWGAMGLAGLVAGPRMGPRAARMPAAPPPRLTPPPREIGPNGMPIAPRRPFTNSLRGSNDDLAEAAAMRRPGPDASGGRGGSTYLDELRAQGFDTGKTYYHGTNQTFESFATPSGIRSGDKAVYLSGSPDYAAGFARGEGANLRPVFVRGPLADGGEYMARRAQLERENPARDLGEINRQIDRELEARGYRGVDMAGLEVRVFSVDDIAPRFGSPPRAPDGGNAGATPERMWGLDAPEGVQSPTRRTVGEYRVERGPPSRPPDGAKTNRNNKPASAGFFFGRRR